MSSANETTRNQSQTRSTSLDKSSSDSAVPSSKQEASQKPNQRYNLRLSTLNYVSARSWKHGLPKNANNSHHVASIAGNGTRSARKAKQKRNRRAKQAAEAQKSEPESYLNDFSALRMAIGSVGIEQRKAQRKEHRSTHRSEMQARRTLIQRNMYQRPTSARMTAEQEDDIINQMQRLMHDQESQDDRQAQDESHILGVAKLDDEEDPYSPYFSDDTTIVGEDSGDI